jgi:hypothetical protein
MFPYHSTIPQRRMQPRTPTLNVPQRQPPNPSVHLPARLRRMTIPVIVSQPYRRVMLHPLDHPQTHPLILMRSPIPALLLPGLWPISIPPLAPVLVLPRLQTPHSRLSCLHQIVRWQVLAMAVSPRLLLQTSAFMRLVLGLLHARPLPRLALLVPALSLEQDHYLSPYPDGRKLEKLCPAT